MKPNEGISFIPEVTESQIRKVRQVLGNVASNVKIIVGGKVGKIILDLKKWLVFTFGDSESSQKIEKKIEKPTGRARQVLEVSGKVASNVDVIANKTVEDRMIKFTQWLSDNIKSKSPSDFTQHEKNRVIQKIEDLKGITYPLGRLFHGNPNHIQTLADLYAQARKAFRNGI
ncbi:MAG: hypothetical protein PHY14_00090 [Candidatus Gracilibacteria bacterium]|nr:hypothetical protein [Candidatus Gracilibacteria bacterium]